MMVLNNKDPTFLPFLHSSSRLPSFFFLCFILSQLIVTAISINQLPDQHVMNFIQSSSTIESHLYKKSRMMHKGKSNTAREVNFTATAAAKSNGVKKSYLLQTNQTKVYANRTSNLTLLSQSHGDKSPQATTSVDCVVSWGDWSVCSTACGTGTQTRTGTITAQSSGTGQACPSDGDEDEVNGLTEERGCTSNEQCDKDENSDDSADTNASIAANTTSNAVKNETLVKQVGNLKQSRATAEADQAVGSTNKAHMQTIKEDGNNKMVFHIANVNVNKAMPNKPTVCPDSTACPQGTKCHMINNVAVCVDIDECKLVENGACGVGYVCINTVGSRVCQDIDECLVDDGGCGVGFLCRNTIGSRICVDIDECAIDNGGCLDGFRCINTIGSRRCVDIDECATTRTGVDDLADPNMKLPDAVASSPSFSSVIAYPDSGDYLAKCDPETETCVNLMGGYKCVPNEREKAELDSNRKIAPNPTFVGLGCSYNLECMHVCDGDNVPGHLASYLPLHGNKMIGGVQDSSSHLLESTGLSSTSTSTKGEDAAVVEEDSGMTDSVSPPASLLQTSGAEPRGVGAFGMSESMSSSGSRRKLLSIREGEGKILLTMEEGACCPLCNDGFCEAGKRLADQTCVSEKIFEQLMMKEKPKGKVLPPNIIVHLID